MKIPLDKKIGIWGLGVVGASALNYFVKNGFTVQAMDQKNPTATQAQLLEQLRVPFFLQDEHLHNFLTYNDYILASCGVDLRPFSPYAHKFLSEVDLFAQECITPIIAITGSVGKTTVTHLLSELLKAQGKKVFTGGNIGVGLLESIDAANAAEFVVLEVSSFQLERCKTFAPDLAVCTNLYPNHLDRHGDMAGYVAAKLNIIARQKAGQKSLLPMAVYETVMQSSGAGTPSFFLMRSSFVNNCVHPFYFLHNAKMHLHYQTNQTLVADLKELPLVSYKDNSVILASILHMLALPLDNFTTVLNKQELPQHRLEKVGSFADIDFYNDSKATIPASTLAAIDKINHRPIVLFLGGVSKGVDRANFVAQLKEKVRMVYCFGKEAEQLKRLCQLHTIPAYSFENLEQAFAILTQQLLPHDQILFSPAGASYDLYTDYRERGDHFKKLVDEAISKRNADVVTKKAD